ncbi:MAG: nucleotidyl transferase AbiEii/AbiGii toxin family protein [Deltaproteobacteria bacterium]|nr:nucleotidyl transferase AbiEii/AbiGii toxin family protein [Deltaproteobacteria bacterium]
MRDPFTYESLRVLLALEEYMPDTVLIGGCAAFVYSKYMFEMPPGQAPVYTNDLDLLVENSLPVSKRSIVSLLEEAGFAGRTFESRHTQYFKFVSRLETGFEVEFLTPAPSREHGDTIVVQGGVRAQVLDGLGMLLIHTADVRISDSSEDVSVDLAVRVPTPGAFVLNKIQSYLDPIGDTDRAKDIYYVFYVLRNLPIDKEAVVADMQKCSDAQTLDGLASRLEPLFADEYSRGTRELAAQLTELDVTEVQKRILAQLDISNLIELMKSN